MVCYGISGVVNSSNPQSPRGSGGGGGDHYVKDKEMLVGQYGLIKPL